MPKRLRLRPFFSNFNSEPHQLAAIDLLEAQMPASLLRDDTEWIRVYRGAGTGARPATDVVRALAGVLELIRKGEGGYCSVNRGRAGDTPGGWAGLDTMTLGQVMQAQDQGKVRAVGAYQFIPTTLRLAASELGISGSTVFSAATQDALAVALLLGSKRPNLAGYLRSRHVDLDAAQLDLAQEWASIPTPEGHGFYDGDASGNRASQSVAGVRRALQDSRLLLAGRGLDSLRDAPEAPGELITAPEPQYYWQRDNAKHADRSCFASSCAMLVKHCKPTALQGSNADLEYLGVVMKYGDTTNADAQIRAMADYGIKARLIKNADQSLIEEQIQRRGALALGWVHNGRIAHPVGGGHWSFCYGYTPKNLLIHDPGGEADLVGGGFVSHQGGRAQRYTRRNFSRRWELIGPPWRYAPGHGWAVVVDSVA